MQNYEKILCVHSIFDDIIIKKMIGIKIVILKA